MEKLYNMVKVLLLRSYRDMSTNVILIAMPLAIIFILGATFSNSSSQEIELSDVEIHISADENSEFKQGLVETLEGIISEQSLIVDSTYEDSKSLLESNRITCFIEIDDSTKEIKLYKNDIINFDASMIEGVIRTYANRMNTVYTIAGYNPSVLSELNFEDTNITKKIGLDKNIKMDAKDYYGITMIILFVFYGIMTPVFEIISDRSEGLLNRMDIANVRPLTVLSSKVLGYSIISIIRVFIVITIATLATNMYWGSTPWLPILYIVAFIITLTTIGVALGYAIKDISRASSSIHLIIVFSAFLGGTYTQVDGIPIIGDLGRYVSINWWANKGLLNSVAANDNEILFQGLIMYGIVTFLLGSFGIYNIKKGEKKFDN